MDAWNWFAWGKIYKLNSGEMGDWMALVGFMSKGRPENKYLEDIPGAF